ncbi:MAG: pseudouridine-5'-phosphate glycosidase, partial [Anaerolineae bacterium]
MDSPAVAAPVTEALACQRPVVALESALITHGFSAPANLRIALRMESAVLEEDALPATIAVLDGKPHIGLSDRELERLASMPVCRKISLRDLAIVAAQGDSGGTTVAATMHLAQRAGIQILATGGIGGVHRDHPEDVSADLTALGSIPIIVVCSGAKAILDLPRTLEILETLGVPVVGFGTEDFPAFYSRRSGLKADAAVDTAAEVAEVARMRRQLGLSAAILVCVPVPEEGALAPREMEAAIDSAMAQADEASVSGKDLTPFLLGRVVQLTRGKAQRANETLLVNNARVAARIA